MCWLTRWYSITATRQAMSMSRRPSTSPCGLRRTGSKDEWMHRSGKRSRRIDHRAVDHTGQAGGDDVALPGGILIPDQLRHAAGERDQVGLAVAIEVCRDRLVAALEVAGDGMFGKARRRAGRQKWEREAKQADAMHAPQYTCRPGGGAMLWRTDRRLPKRLFGRG